MAFLLSIETIEDPVDSVVCVRIMIKLLQIFIFFGLNSIEIIGPKNMIP